MAQLNIILASRADLQNKINVWTLFISCFVFYENMEKRIRIMLRLLPIPNFKVFFIAVSRIKQAFNMTRANIEKQFEIF